MSRSDTAPSDAVTPPYSAMTAKRPTAPLWRRGVKQSREGKGSGEGEVPSGWILGCCN